MENKNDVNQSDRIRIIETVQTPLGFFTLSVLVVEVILGITANFSQELERNYLIISMVALIFFACCNCGRFCVFQARGIKGKTPNCT
jgi:hypothetical protein